MQKYIAMQKEIFVSQDPKTVATFSIQYQRYLNENGEFENECPEYLKDPDKMRKVYQMMVKTRLFDRKAVMLQRTGKLGTYPATLGQEAICVSIGASMQEDDILCPYYREYGAQFWRGVTMEEILLYWGGDEEGSNFQNNKHDFPICVPIASQTLHAVGAAFSIQYKKQKRAVVTTIGDGGTSRGDFYEALNCAGIWKLPVVFVINSNFWAISTPRDKQCAAETLAQKGIACGVPGVQVDGNDTFAVRDAVETALERARNGEGPTVIEAMTYRMCDHTTADDASRYRDDAELKANEKYDPISRLKKYLISQGHWDEEREKQMIAQCGEAVAQAVQNYFDAPTPPAEHMFDYLFETLPKAYEEQYRALQQGVK